MCVRATPPTLNLDASQYCLRTTLVVEQFVFRLVRKTDYDRLPHRFLYQSGQASSPVLYQTATFELDSVSMSGEYDYTRETTRD